MHTTRRPLRRLLLVPVVALLALLLSGCFGGQATKPLEQDAFQQLGQEMVRIEAMTADELTLYLGEQEAEIGRMTRAERTNETKESLARTNLLLGYASEFRKTTVGPVPREGVYRDARAAYEDATQGNTAYAAQARYRLGVLGSEGLIGPRDESIKLAKRELNMLKMAQDVPLWVRVPALAGDGGAATLATEDGEEPLLVRADAGEIAHRELDVLYRTGGGFDQAKYEAVDAIVTAFDRVAPPAGAAGMVVNGAVLALLLLAILVKLVTLPLTNMTFRGMRDMQRVQPLLKALQAEYKDDKAKLAEEQMRLMKEHKVNPASGCLPMLIQLPIFIVVYQAVMVYAYPFTQYRFLWIDSLAQPNLILLLLYAASMFVTQKLTTMPAADPQQKVMQQQMTIMMPIFLFFILISFASAFVLYWLLLNILSSAHQYYLMRKFAREDALKAAAVASVPAPVANTSPDRPRKRGKKR